MHKPKRTPKPNPLVRLYEPPAESEPDMALFRSFAVVVLPGEPGALEATASHAENAQAEQAPRRTQPAAEEDASDSIESIEVDAASLPALQRIIRERNELARLLAETQAALREAQRRADSRPTIYLFTSKFIDQALRAADAIRATAEHSSSETDRLAYLEVGELVRAADEYRGQLQKASVQA